MSTQYNKIQAPYDFIRKKSISLIEHENVHTTVAPYIKEARVLELACGSGFYTYDLLKWGAKSVVALDISSGMIEEARRQGEKSAVGKERAEQDVKFILGDASKPTIYEDGEFDVVFGAWFLNYAPDRAGLVDMFRNICMNLKAGGHFVSVTCPPASNPFESMEAELKLRPPPEGSGGLYYNKIHDVEDGIFFHCHGKTPVGDVAFDTYHLKQEIYKEAAREAGLNGELSWAVNSIPERYLKGEGPGGASIQELESYLTVSNYGLLVIGK
ncbi:MAG: hypothetical protein Q9201_003891 [Fulgogasparrea decipioides]